MLARAIHNEHFLLQCLKKEIATTKELDLRLVGKVIIFRDTQTDKQNLPIIYRSRILKVCVPHHREHLGGMHSTHCGVHVEVLP